MPMRRCVTPWSWQKRQNASIVWWLLGFLLIASAIGIIVWLIRLQRMEAAEDLDETHA